MALEITVPFETTSCKCGDTGAVCVKGTGAKHLGQLAVRVYGKNYPDGSTLPGPTDPPPADAAEVEPAANGDWCLDYVGGANCSTEVIPSTGKYPKNTVVVWAKYEASSSSSSSSGTSYYYVKVDEVFYGNCKSDPGACCNSSSSSSSP